MIINGFVKRGIDKEAYTITENLHGTMRVKFNLGSNSGNNLNLYLMHCSRRRGTQNRWRHPDNYDVADSIDRLGYGIMSGTNVHDNDDSLKFPEIPDWMPNGGFMRTEIALTEENIDNGYIDINSREYFLPMLKCYPTNNEYGIVGIDPGTNFRASQIFRFDLEKNGEIIGIGRNEIHFGGKCYRDGNYWSITIEDGRIRANTMYLSIK